MEKIVFYFFLCAIIGACSATNPLARITFGDTVDIKDYPYQVSLGLLEHGDGPPEHFCGGSIIDKNYILTAAHCLVEADHLKRNENPLVEVLKIRTGTSELNSSRQGNVFDVASYKIHPDFDYVTSAYDNDIALIKLSKPIEFTDTQKPIELTSQPIQNGTVGTVTGWGRTEESGISQILRKTTATLIDHVKCLEYAGNFVIEIFEKNICGYNENWIKYKRGYGYPSACGGDSGGPVVADKKLVGIVSHGFSSRCINGRPTIYVDVYDYLDFIKAGLEN